jgi:GTP cyclohydrolase I
MAMRGVEKQNSYTITSAMLGAFREQSRTRMEFLELLKLRGGVVSSGPTHSHDFDESD